MGDEQLGRGEDHALVVTLLRPVLFVCWYGDVCSSSYAATSGEPLLLCWWPAQERQLPAGLPSPLPAQDEEQEDQGEGGDQDEEGGRGIDLGCAGQRIRAQVAVTRASERKRCRDAFEFPPSDADGEGAGKGDQDVCDGAGDVGCVTLGDSSSGSEGSRGYVLKGKVATAAALAARPAARGTPHATPKTRSGASPSPGARGRHVSSGGQGSGGCQGA